MFMLTKLADLVQIAPQDFSKESAKAIEDNINAKYANRVIHKIGLCVCLWDITWTSEGLVSSGNGYANVNVEFRMVVFRPFKNEVIQARILSQTQEGISVATDFFYDIFVPKSELPDGAEFEAKEGVWIWKVDGAALYYDNHELVRVRVISEEWHDQAPQEPLALEDQPASELLSPYKIIGSMNVPGLGCTIWWDD
ncbi:RNA polymerase III subunit Rpc25-domain-containing protein [Echria macrotheca]|uniref:DNA-directed RNA polymerase subunit n=1 Tax=Echria macrotheca TaxID=438768 RepID=A0AAJ0BH82_9PEZI|nr:RNA polymerase III subunit Rpc25-domain-containing protein [Echria macrotheca]